MTLKVLHEAMTEALAGGESPDPALFEDFVERVGRLVATFEKWGERQAVADDDESVRLDLA